jgi:hypothetical protein
MKAASGPDLAPLTRLFTLSLPPLAFTMAVYAGTSNAVFGLAALIGKRLRPGTKAGLRNAYLLASCLVAGTLHLALLLGCVSGDDPCVEGGGPLHDARCFSTAAIAIVAMLCIFAADRVATPLLGIVCDACCVTFHARVVRATAVVVVWLGLGEQATLTLVLLLMITARRTFCRLEIMNALSGTSLKLYTVLSTASVLGGHCESSSKRVAVAAATATFLV